MQSVHAYPVPRVLALLAMVMVAAPEQARAEQRVQELETFTRVEFSGAGELLLTQSGDHRITLTAEPEVLERVDVRVSDGTLYVERKADRGWAFWSSANSGDLRVAVELAEVEAVGLAGSGDGSADALRADSFELTVRGSGSMQIGELITGEAGLSLNGSGDLAIADLQSTLVGAAVVGSGDMQLFGRVETLEASLSGSGDLDATGLEARHGWIELLGSGDVDVWVLETLAAYVTGSGDIRYRGRPQVKETVTGSGRVTRRQE